MVKHQSQQIFFTFFRGLSHLRRKAKYDVESNWEVPYEEPNKTAWNIKLNILVLKILPKWVTKEESEFFTSGIELVQPLTQVSVPQNR